MDRVASRGDHAVARDHRGMVLLISPSLDPGVRTIIVQGDAAESDAPRQPVCVRRVTGGQGIAVARLQQVLPCDVMGRFGARGALAGGDRHHEARRCQHRPAHHGAPPLWPVGA